jgi:ribulose-5-phosphate 4-epimerase/fuculose-1-phosphate aldolase
MQFWGDIGYHDYEGITENLEERAAIAANLGDKNVLMMRSHGVVTCGVTVRDAFMRMKAMAEACDIQLRLQAADAEIVMPPDDVLEKQMRQRATHNAGRGADDWPATLRKLDQIDPSYRD